jgi:hypothetical protein
MMLVAKVGAAAGMVSIGLVLVACTGPTASSSSGQPVSAQSRVIGPDGYGGVNLGMSADEVLRTGVVVADGPLSQPCSYYRFRTSAPGSTDVLVSAKLGVMLIDPRDGVRTPEGIGTGSSRADLRAAYPDASFDGPGLVASTGVPGKSGSLYRFELNDSGQVSHVSIQATGGDCAG